MQEFDRMLVDLSGSKEHIKGGTKWIFANW